MTSNFLIKKNETVDVLQKRQSEDAKMKAAFHRFEREEMVEMTENFANGTFAAYWLKLLSFSLSLIDDVSLKSGSEGQRFKHLKNPHSLKVSSKNVIDNVTDFFRVVHNSMADVIMAFSDVPEKMRYISAALKKKDDDSVNIVCWAITCIQGAVNSSTTAVKDADAFATRTYKLVTEFSDAVQGIKGLKDENSKEVDEKIKNTLELQAAKKQAADEAKATEEKEYEAAEKKSAEFLAQLKKDEGFVRNVAVTLQDIVYCKSNGPNRRQTMMNNLEHLNRMAQESRQRADRSRRERFAANQEALEVLKTLSNLKADQIDLNEIIKYLPEIIENIAKVQNALTEFRFFFDSIKRKVNSNIIKNMNEFIDLAKKGGGADVQDILNESVKLCASGIALMEIAKIFKLLSKDYIIPQINQARLYFAKTKQASLEEKAVVCDGKAFIDFNARVTSLIKEHNERIPQDVTNQYAIQQ